MRESYMKSPDHVGSGDLLLVELVGEENYFFLVFFAFFLAGMKITFLSFCFAPTEIGVDVRVMRVARLHAHAESIT